MKRLIAEEVWRFFKLFIVSTGLFVVSLLLLRDIGYLEESQFSIFMPYLLLVYALILIGDLVYRYVFKKAYRRRTYNRRLTRPEPSPVGVSAMIFTSVMVINSSMMIFRFDTPIEGPEAFIQILVLLVLIFILVGMIFSSYLKEWYENLDREELFSRFVETGEKHLFKWTSILFTGIVFALGAFILILSITLNIETGLSMHETLIKIFGAVFVLALIARFIMYRRRVMEAEERK